MRGPIRQQAQHPLLNRTGVGRPWQELHFSLCYLQPFKKLGEPELIARGVRMLVAYRDAAAVVSACVFWVQAEQWAVCITRFRGFSPARKVQEGAHHCGH